ncbi:MAG: hypothetical protein GXP19_10205 [Gammaproteobacteria bacterium]|nr:hypothetical protein [Gammaproteobacteria bacterium]
MVTPDTLKDIDFWVWIDKRNAERIVQTLQDFGFSSLDIKDEDFLSPGYVVQLGQPPSRIDLLTSVTGLDFEECYASKVHIYSSRIGFRFYHALLHAIFERSSIKNTRNRATIPAYFLKASAPAHAPRLLPCRRSERPNLTYISTH